MADSITVAIGNIKKQYVLKGTNVPPEYDASGTVTIFKGRYYRLVLIEKQHEQWYQGKCAAGMFWFTKVENIPEDYVIEKLWKKLLK